MTRNVTVIGFEHVGPLQGYVGDQWAVWVRDGGVNRIWLYTAKPEQFKVDKTYQV